MKFRADSAVLKSEKTDEDLNDHVKINFQSEQDRMVVRVTGHP